VVPYRPEDAKSISREVTFQKDVASFDLLRDVLLLLSFCVEHRAKRYGLHGKGVTLKLTYGDMRTITRSRLTAACESAEAIFREAEALLDRVERRPVRLIGVGIYQLSGEEGRQLYLEEFFRGTSDSPKPERERLLEGLRDRYGLDFAGHLEQIYGGETLHKTVEYMRKHGGA
jgi:DNA polymerase-4/DNA polymerase IV (DinB-like DNA polymerase)